MNAIKRLRLYIPVVLILFLFVSCSTTHTGFFEKQTLHEQYGKKLTNAGLKETALGRQWFAAAEEALQKPAAVSLPYSEGGYFSSDKPGAVGLRFLAKQGEKLQVTVAKKPVSGFALYIDFWQLDASGQPRLLAYPDTLRNSFDYEVEKEGAYLLRLQPELLQSGEYTVSISVGPTLGFPVAGSKGRIGSVWGDDRDAGARRHEGIDIFAPKRTPVVAAYNGTISAVNENTLGGKVVWLRPQGKNYTLYYAHLDEQLVAAGQVVSKGDTLGLIGNTGNARTTPSHLHFGLYMYSGAVNPLPYINPVVKNAPTLKGSSTLKKEMRLKSNLKIGDKTHKINTLVFPLAVNENGYRVLFPDGTTAQTPLGILQELGNPVRQAKLKDTAFLYDQPNTAAPRKRTLNPFAPVSIYAYYNDFAYIRLADSTKGWISLSLVK